MKYLTGLTKMGNTRTIFFKYGYVGKFDRTFLDKNMLYYEYTPDFVDKNGQTVNSYTYTGRQELPVKLHPAQQILSSIVHSYLIAHCPR